MKFNGFFAALALGTAICGGMAVLTSTGPAKAVVSQPVPARPASVQLVRRVPATALRAEGVLLGAPKAGVDQQLAHQVEPGVMSIVFSDEKTAWDFYHEAVSNGEMVCLSDLGPQRPQQHGQRYWLRSC